MSDTYPLRWLRGNMKERSFNIPFKEAEIRLDMPSPLNLKSWSVHVAGIDASGMAILDDCYYYGNRRLVLSMETLMEKRLRGEVIIRSVTVGPRSRVSFSGSGLLEGFERL
ncbi:hypothetical protein [Melghirimyces algeriensis]|uniref:PilZ domain-containing protein n=1 Tax=Melghirimyces algeriensis TaxID=910412 RepID=A0A521AR35_9BACL|nr:hypothetical protein [Melghirimyces algeriensis]SMO37245.1 hypothetical protein SAMN06264849_101290 [Melghirimyces algeriensis]